MSISTNQIAIPNGKNRIEDPDFGKVAGRKRDLRWKTFRQNISEERSITFHSRPDTTRLSNDFIELIEEKCGDGQHDLQDLEHDEHFADTEPFEYLAPKARGSSFTLLSCPNDGKHRLEFAGNQLDRDITLLSVLSAKNICHAHGFGPEAFGTEETRHIPEALTLTGEAHSVDLGNTSKQTVHCPYLFFNQATTSARHDIEWALNRCALDGSSALRALDVLQNAVKSEEESITSQSNLTLFSCALSQKWAILNHHWVSDGRICMAPLCKFDLRVLSHKHKLQAWIEAIGKWAEVRLLPLFRQMLKTLSEWDEVINDPLNTTPANEFERLTLAASSDPVRKDDHVRHRADFKPATSTVVFPSSVPATSMGLHFPAESTERILSWQRDIGTWQNVPSSAGLLPKANYIDGGQKSYRSLDETAEDLENPDDYYTRPSTPAIILPITAKNESKTHLRTTSVLDYNSAQQKPQHGLRPRKLGDTRLAVHSRKTSSATHLGIGNSLRQSQSSQDTKYSLPLRSPLFQCHNNDGQEYLTPPSSVATEFEDGLTPKMPDYESHALPSCPGICENVNSDTVQNEMPSTYSSIAEWAQQQRGLLETEKEEVIFPVATPCIGGEERRPESELEQQELNSHLVLQAETASPIGNDRASMTMWIDHVLGERMICIEE